MTNTLPDFDGTIFNLFARQSTDHQETPIATSTLPDFDGTTLKKISLKRKPVGPFDLNEAPCMAASRDGAARAMLFLALKYALPHGTEHIDPVESPAPSLRYLYLQERGRIAEAREEDKPYHREALGEITVHQDFVRALIPWLVQLDERGQIRENSSFSADDPAPDNKCFDVFYREGDEHDAFTFLYRFLDSLFDFTLKIKEIRSFG